jgi:choline dehydrogenase-like flavoprotein
MPAQRASGRPLNSRQRAVARALIQSFVGIAEGSEQALLDLAVERCDGFLQALADPESATPLRLLLNVVHAYIVVRFRCGPQALSEGQRAVLLRDLCEPESTRLGRALELLNRRAGKPLPTGRDLLRSLRQLCVLVYYSNPDTGAITGYVPVWKRSHILAAAPELVAPPERVPVAQIVAKHREGSWTPVARLFANDGRPKVAIIGSGAGGAVVAARLAATCDVAVFEAGPSFSPQEYPLDTLSGMALLYRDGLMSFSKNLDLQVLAGRLVGGGTALTSGMSVKPRRSTMQAWQRSGIDSGQLSAGLDAVEKRLRLEPPEEDLLSDLGHLWRAENSCANEDLLFEVPLSNAAMSRRQHAENPHRDAQQRGDRCLACGLCNYGCHFGHKLSVDQTYLKDARALNARVHPNTAVESLVSSRDPRTGQTRIIGIRLARDPKAPMVPVDHVVLAAGAIGSPQVLLRSMQLDDGLARLACASQVGKGLGFNYGTSVVAEWPNQPARPGDTGIQIHYIASKPSDESFVLENAFLPPALMATVAPGMGAVHRDWMSRYRRLGMAVSTIGSPQTGSVSADGRVSYAIGDGEMGVIRESLGLLVRSYLRAGAARVGVSGVRTLADSSDVFYPGEQLNQQALLEKVTRIAAAPDHLTMMSAHPQGGLRIDADPTRGAVRPDFRVHGVDNLMVADASLFPSTIVVNPQWTVMALADVAARAISSRIGRESAQSASRPVPSHAEAP